MDQNATPAPATQRPGGRTERNRQAVHGAVLELLKDHGPSFTYHDLAERSGVSRRTLHRRWPDRTELIAETLRADYGRLEVPFTGDVATDLREYALRFRDFAARPTSVLVDGLAALAPDAELAHLSKASFEQSTADVRAILADAAQHGRLSAEVDLDTILNMLMSPIVVSCSILREPLTDDEVTTLVEHVLRAASA
ncbi:TetR/AcrR family transcriptional regulator C-terminal ligand-binding domain-containing protein [Streptomyces sp. NPDC004539]|uniref:TetR/AcrR family transcriptional regulator n=1 Tax=Streptomyces sp. NPDC004539 TaxID=3154280 RepID=UPI0033A71993